MSTLETNLQNLITAKTDIENAIIAKGGTITGGGFSNLANDVSTINSYPIPEKFNYSRRQQATQSKVFYVDKWVTKTWNGSPPYMSSGQYIWTDGTNIYYSYGSYQYVLDKSTSTWSTKTWTGLTPNGEYIWTDGTDIYYSSGTNAVYVLDKSTSTWNTKTFVKKPYKLDTAYIWTDGDNIYVSEYMYSSIESHVLDKSTSTWSTKTFTTPQQNMSVTGDHIWTDGHDIYYSLYNGSSSSQKYHWVLDKSTSTWSNKTWYDSDGNVFKDFDSSSIWTDGYNIYCSIYGKTNFLVLDTATSTWYPKVFYSYSNVIHPNWTDGINVYCTSGNQTQVLVRTYIQPSSTPITIKTTACTTQFTS